jgi:hypothetical protein
MQRLSIGLAAFGLGAAGCSSSRTYATITVAVAAGSCAGPSQCCKFAIGGTVVAVGRWRGATGTRSIGRIPCG